MAGFDFFVDVVRSGTVLGADWTDHPDEVTTTLGTGFAENRPPGVMWRDYGLVEFSWEHAADGRWVGSHFTVQAHRLAHGEPDLPSPAITARYGRMPPRVRFTELQQALQTAGCPLITVAQADSDLIGFWQPESTTLVLVVAENPSPTGNASTLDPGDVYAVVAPHRAEWTIPRDPAAQRSGVDQARHLLQRNDQARQAWLASHPRAAQDANWWAHQFLHIDARIRRQVTSRQAWVRLRLWLLDRAAVMGIYAGTDIVVQRSMFVSELYARGIAYGLSEVIPSADMLVSECLDAIPVTMAELDQIPDWRLLDLAKMRRLRHAKNLINAAEWHLPRITDAVLADRLRLWIAARPRMV